MSSFFSLTPVVYTRFTSERLDFWRFRARPNIDRSVGLESLPVERSLKSLLHVFLGDTIISLQPEYVRGRDERTLGDSESAKKEVKPDDVVKAVEAMERVLKYGFGPEDRQLLTEILQTLSDIRDRLDVIQFKLGVEENVWRRFPDSDVEWTFARTPDGKPAEGLEEIMDTLTRNEYGNWVQTGAFEYRWSGTDDDPKRFIHRRLAK